MFVSRDTKSLDVEVSVVASGKGRSNDCDRVNDTRTLRSSEYVYSMFAQGGRFQTLN